MFKKIIFLLALLVAFPSWCFAQDEPCLEPNSIVHSEISVDENRSFLAEVDGFKRRVDETKPEQGIVIVFGGKRSKVDEVPNLIQKVEQQLKIVKTDYQRRFWVRDGGFRVHASLVFIIRPLKCSDFSVPLPDFDYGQVEFEGFGEESTVTTNSADFWSLATEKPKAQCPPAARAVRACIDGTPAEVYVLVDRQGKVVFAKTIGGHPLIRAAAESNLKGWTIKPLTIGGVSMNRSGIIRIEFGEGPDILTN